MAEQFKHGEEASRGKLVETLEEIHSKGTEVLEQLEEARLDSLVDFDRRLGAMNSRRQRANRVKTPGMVGRFVVSDLIDVDQGRTTATVRADARAVSLRERSNPQDADLRSVRFLVSTGTVENLDTSNRLFRVHTLNNQVPTGTFDLELVAAVQVTLLVFDISATPSDPKIVVEVSPNGVTYIPASQVLLNGYRVTAWVEATKTRFVRVTITPTHPDNLLGSVFTFGLTSFAADALDFHLRSELLFRTITWEPRSSKVRFRAPEEEGISYFLALGESGTTPAFIEVQPDDEILIPGTSDVAPVSVGFVGLDWTVQPTSVADTPLELGTFIKPSTPNGFRYEVTTAGTTGSDEPTWPTSIDDTVVSGTVTFTCRADGAGTLWSSSESTLADTALSLGDRVRPTVPNGFTYEVTTAGTTGSTEPVWPTTLGQTVVSGTVTFTCRKDGLLDHTLPTDAYITTLEVVEDGTGNEVRVAPGLSFLDSRAGRLVNDYIGVVGQQMHLVRNDVAADVGKTFTLSYSTGPASAQARLRVVLATEDRALSPLFREASLEEV